MNDPILTDLHRMVGELNGKVDILIEDRPETERRIRSLERKWAFGTGIYATLSAIIAGAVSLFSLHSKV